MRTVISTIAFEAGVAGGASAILACPQSRLNYIRIAVHWILTPAGRASLRSSEISGAKLALLAVVLIDSNLLISLLIFQSLANQGFIV